MSLNKLTILIPCYNEEGTLERIVHEVLAANTLDLEKEVIIIDDGSSDRSYEIAQDISKKNSNVKEVISFEVPSSTEWYFPQKFSPNIFVFVMYF